MFCEDLSPNLKMLTRYALPLQVAFLAALVGPRVAASAAQAALKSLAEDDPVGFLSDKNSFGVDGSDICDSTLATGFSER